MSQIVQPSIYRVGMCSNPLSLIFLFSRLLASAGLSVVIRWQDDTIDKQHLRECV